MIRFFYWNHVCYKTTSDTTHIKIVIDAIYNHNSIQQVHPLQNDIYKNITVLNLHHHKTKAMLDYALYPNL